MTTEALVKAGLIASTMGATRATEIVSISERHVRTGFFVFTEKKRGVFFDAREPLRDRVSFVTWRDDLDEISLAYSRLADQLAVYVKPRARGQRF